MKNLSLIFVLSIFFFLQYANAQTDKGTWLLGGNAAFQSQDGQSLFTINPNLGYFVANRFVVGLSATYLNSDGLSALAFGPGVRAYFLTTERGSLFGQIGFNYIRFEFDNLLEPESETGYNLGLGYAVFLNKSVALEFSGNYSKYGFSNNTGFGDSQGLFAFNVGFQIHFNKE